MARQHLGGELGRGMQGNEMDTHDCTPRALQGPGLHELTPMPHQVQALCLMKELAENLHAVQMRQGIVQQTVQKGSLTIHSTVYIVVLSWN